MDAAGQLNIHSYKNLRSRSVQTVSLFDHEELRAELVVLPPGATVERHQHTNCHELFDVIEGEGAFLVGERRFPGGPGKCIFVPAGEAHSLHNEGDTPWVLRVTYQEQLGARHLGRWVRRTLQRKLGIRF